tara:strand:- start:3112 stop:4848 length:1737 start_codon:yes stop_codon:yes gene_type:complete
MNILGLNIFHADTAACLIIDGKINCAAEEERFTRIKHYAGFPVNAIKFCLANANLSLHNIDFIAVNFNSRYNFYEKLKYSVFSNPVSLIKKLSVTYKKNSIKSILEKNFISKFSGEIIYVPHHLSHVSSSFLCSGLDKAIGLTIDGSGDFSTSETYLCEKNQFKLLNKINYPHSLGIFFQAFTQFLGFRNYGDEYKVMGLASYGKPIYKDKIFKNIILKNEENFKLNLKYFTHHRSEFSYYFENGIPVFENLFSNKITNLFGNPRDINAPITIFHQNLASSVQAAFEEVVLLMIKKISEKYQNENLVLSGGCIFNSVLNGKIKKLELFKNIYISSNVGDAGGAIGAALFVSSIKDDEFKNKKITHSYYGTSYSSKYVEENIINQTNLNSMKIEYEIIKDFDSLILKTCEYLKNKKLVGWFQDKMEWGPRALGNRSILAHPGDINLRDKINLMVKNREDFRPFAPSILEECANDFVELKRVDSNFMNLVLEVNEYAKKNIEGTVHADYTCRFHTVSKKNNIKFYNLIKEFYSQTNIPAILNTSLNMNEPICENPTQAFDLFAKSSLDILVLQNWVFKKK